MKQQTITITKYEYDELKPEVQQKVLEKFRDINVDYYWAEPTIWEAKDKLEALGYTDIEIFYSGFGNQGDGACFEAKVDIGKWLKAHKLAGKYRALYNRSEDGTFQITHKGRYYHERSMELENQFYDTWGLAGRQCEAVYELVEQEIVELSKQIYKELEHEYYWRLEDNSVIDTIRANEYEFLEDGQQAIAI